MADQLSKEDLEKKKLKCEIRVLAHQGRWEGWKAVATTVVPLLTLVTIVGGGIKYFHDEENRQQLRREEVFSLSLKNLGSTEEYVRLGGLVSILSYVGKDKGYDGRVAAVLTLHYLKEPSVYVRRTVLGNLRRWKEKDKIMFADFLESVRNDLQQVNKNLQAESNVDKRKSFEQEKLVLEGVERLLMQI